MNLPSRPLMADADIKIALDISSKMLNAVTFDDRWEAIQDVLGRLGATSVNIAALCPRSSLPFWFRSSLPPQALSDYVSEGLLDSDFIVKHAAKSTAGLYWRTADATLYEEDPAGRTFGNFVRDVGTRSIVCLTARPNPGRDVRAITFCSDHAPSEVMTDAHLRLIDIAVRLLLPWLDWPEIVDGPGFLPMPGPGLSPRETQALRLLAGGMMNARIADAMGISEAMVAKHLTSARRKLDAKTREEAVARAVRSAQIHP